MANKVPLRLPPESMQWGRSVEERLSNIERLNSNLDTSVVSANASLGAILKTSLQTQTQVNFLNNQTSYAVAGASRSLVLPLGVADTTWEPFDPLYDPSSEVVTTSTGRILLAFGSPVILLPSLANIEATVYLRVEILQGGVVVHTTKTIRQGIDRFPLGATLSGTLSTQVETTQNPNTSYSARLRMGYYCSGSCTIQTGDGWLSVTKLGL